MVTGRCQSCGDIAKCTECGEEVREFRHVGVRGSGLEKSSIWHYAEPCGHRVKIDTGSSQAQVSGLAKYQGGPVWKAGYQWYNIFWGTYWKGNKWIDMLNKAVQDIESSSSYSGELSQYNVGIGKFSGHALIEQDPPSTVSEGDIKKTLPGWIANSVVPDFKDKGAYNIFLPPGVNATLGQDSSCVKFCDYHDTVSGTNGPFFTLEPYPCSAGCNQCNSNDFDTLTQGLSEEMVELKTDMDPGTGWVIGNEEVCDYCDKNFVCNKISTGEFVNAWYSDKAGACWTPG